MPCVTLANLAEDADGGTEVEKNTRQIASTNRLSLLGITSRLLRNQPEAA
jgi:hypothetical protein